MIPVLISRFTGDIYAMAAAVASLYGNGDGILAEIPEIAFEMMNWDQELLKKKGSSSSHGKAAVAKDFLLINNNPKPNN